MATCAISTLIQQACANDFVTAANDVQLYRAIKHQLLCNISANGGGGGGAVWGLITGTLTNQADLVAALAAANAPDLIVDNIDLDIAVPYNAAHGLGSLPQMMRCVLVFEDGSTLSYSAGDEMDVIGLYDGTNSLQRVSFGASATNVWVSITDIISGWASPSVPVKTGGTTPFINAHAKLYVWI